MTRINTNIESLRGLRATQNANNLLSTSLSRLSSGLKINSGKDSPAGLIGSETLRAQVTSIEQSIKNSNRANNVIATADGALGEIGGLLNQIRGLVQEGLNDGALSQSEIEANQSQIDAALSAINRISANTTFAGDKLIDGSKAFTTQISSADRAELSDFQINEAILNGGTVNVDATVVTAASQGELQYRGGDLTAAATLEVSGSKGSQVLFLGGSSTVTNVRDAINAVSDITGVEANISSAAVAGTLTTSLAGANNDLVFTDARATAGTGEFSESISIVYADPGGASQALGVAVTQDGNGNHIITVSLATDGSSAITSTAAQVRAAIEANDDAAALVTVANASGNDGSGVVTALASTALSGGANAVLELTSSQYGSAEFVGVNVLSGTFNTVLDDGTTSSFRDEGTDVVARINGQTAQGKGLTASVKTASLDASVSFTTAANTAGTNSVVTITGGGSLFQIGQEVSAAGQIGIGIEAVNTARLGGVSGKLYELGSGAGKSLFDVGNGGVSGEDLVSILDEAINRVATLRGRLGSVQKNVIETNITTLGVALENISEARSQIVDTDFAEETAALTKAQILSQASLSVLGIANQNPNQVLSLLR